MDKGHFLFFGHCCWVELFIKILWLLFFLTGERCHVIGTVSMDAVTVEVSTEPEPHEMFTIITADFDPQTSAIGIANQLQTINTEVTSRIITRVPRYYSSSKNGDFVMKYSSLWYGSTKADKIS